MFKLVLEKAEEPEIKCQHLLDHLDINKTEIDVFLELSCFAMRWWDQMPWSLFSECWALSQLFHSPLSIWCRVHHAKCQAGWITSWNQDCWKIYQQPQICRWYHPYGRKWRGTKEPLDEGERGEWKSWLKLNIQKTKIMASHSHPFMANRRRKSRNSDRFSFLGLQNHCAQWLQSWK